MLALALLVALQQQPAALPALPPQGGDTSPFRRLDLPAPSSSRTGAGAPGPGYWQQRVDYVIRATLDTATHTLAGRETIRYSNRSPDTLRYVWIQLDQNIYRTDSRGSAMNPPGTRFAGAGFVGGYVIDELTAVRRSAGGGRPDTKVPLATTLNGMAVQAATGASAEELHRVAEIALRAWPK